MEFELTWVDPSLVVCRTSGVAEVKGYEELIRALTSSPEFGPEVRVLMDHTALDVSPITATDMEEIASLRARFAGEGKTRSAVVVGSGSPLRYGLSRMFEGYVSSQVDFEIGVFEEFDEALAWLQADDANSAP
ncbi:MAG: STAS/SEC14 domain-containing protein [Gaiellaceae bacterium]